MSRPNVPPQLIERTDRIHKLQCGYEAASFQEALATALELAEANIDDPASATSFAVSQFEQSGDEYLWLRFTPSDSSPARFRYFSKGNPPHTTVFETGVTFIGQDELQERIGAIEGVSRCIVPNTTGTIEVGFDEEAAAVDTVRDRVSEALVSIINEAEERVRNGEETAQDAWKRAVKPYWKHA